MTRTSGSDASIAGGACAAADGARISDRSISSPASPPSAMPSAGSPRCMSPRWRRPRSKAAMARLIWAIGALYFSCAALRLARFNVSNKHGEQHHFSFLGLPSPGAGGAVAAWILMQQDLRANDAYFLANTCIFVLPAIVLATG